MARDTKKTLKREKYEKRNVYEKFNNVTTTIKFFAFILEKDIFSSKTKFGKILLHF